MNLKNKFLTMIASVCIKLLTIDSVRVWFITKVLREIKMDDVIQAMKDREDKAREKSNKK